MPDAVQTLSTAVQADLAGSGANAADVLALSSAIVQGSQAYLQSVLNRRIGILQSVMNVAVLPPDFTVGNMALAWNEVQTAFQFQQSAEAFDQNLAALNGPGAVNVPPAQLTAWANSLVSASTAYEALLLVTLPS
jgi:hypothetical protein